MTRNNAQYKRNEEGTQAKKQRAVFVLLEIININLTTRLEHDIQHTQRAKNIDCRALADKIEYRRTYHDTRQDKAHDTWHVNLTTHEWHKPNDANHEGES